MSLGFKRLKGSTFYSPKNMLVVDSKRCICFRCEWHSWSGSTTSQLRTPSQQGGSIPTIRPLQAR